MTIQKNVRQALIKCQNDITTYQMPTNKPDQKKRSKGDMETHVLSLLNLIPGIQEKDRDLRKELHSLQKTFKQFAEKENDENLAAFQNELARIQELLDNIEKGA